MSIDAKRDEYRKYLERTGAMDALTKVLVALYEESEKPEDSVAYIKRNLGGVSEEAGLAEQLASANERIKELEHQLAQSKGAAAPEPEKPAPEAPKEEAPAAEKPAEEEKPPEPEKEQDKTEEPKEPEAAAATE